MAEQKKPRVPLAAVVVGGLVAGAALFGAFRGMSAQPLPPVEVKGDDPFGALPVPTLPPTDLSPLPAPPIQQTGAALPPVTPIQLPALPKVDAQPDLSVPPLPADPKAVELPAAPKPDPLPALPPTKIDLIPEMVTPKPLEVIPVLPKPVEVPPVMPKLEPVVPTLPKLADVAPVLPKLDPVVPVPAATLPKPAEIPQPVTPTPPPAVIPPVKPEPGLRPELPPLTVHPGPAPVVGPETLPPPKKVGNETLPPPRPVVEESVAPTPPPDVARIAAPTPPGSTPMLPVSRHALLSTVMGAALAAAPAFADDPKPVDAKAVEALQKQIDDMKKDITALKDQRNELNKQLNGIPDSQRKTDVEKGVVIRLDEAEKASVKMADKVKDLEAQLALKSVSEKSPVGGTGGTTISPGRGLVKIVNEYNTKVAMVVNGISYPLAVDEVKQIEVPEGKLKYELVDFPNAVAKETTIKEGETVTLRIKK